MLAGDLTDAIMKEETERRGIAVQDSEETASQASSSDSEKREDAVSSVDEEKVAGVGLESGQDEITTVVGDAHRPRAAHAKSLRSIKSHQSRAGADGYTCFDDEERTPNKSSGDTAVDEPFLVSWEGGDADPMNPRSMTKLRRWTIVCIVSASSLCV